MKRRGLLLSLLLLVVITVITGNRITAYFLDQRLAPLLSEQLGLPVSIYPMDADLLTLTASTHRLVIGAPENPAIDARDVKVSISVDALLQGKIRLENASSDDIVVQLSNWPANDDPWPEDYYFLDQWLPKQLSLAQGRYVATDGDTWPVEDLEWRRTDEGAALAWNEQRAGGEVSVETTLSSLSALLGMTGFEIQVALEVPNTPDTELVIAITPKADGGYALHSSGELAGMSVDIEAGYHLAQLESRGPRGIFKGQLLDSLEGEVRIAGSHQGRVDTPVAISAQLNTRKDALALESLDIRAGNARATGSLVFAGSKQRTLALQLDGESLDLNFLFDDPDSIPLPGLGIPEYLGLFPGIKVRLDVDARDLQVPGAHLARARITADRGVERGQVEIEARDIDAGTLAVRLNYEPAEADTANVDLVVNMGQINLEQLITGEEGLFNARTSGSLVLNSQGRDIGEIFEAMRGDADLNLIMTSRDVDEGKPTIREELHVTGGAGLVVDSGRILGLRIENLNIDSLQQDLSGEITMVAGRSPWFTAELQSRRISIARVLEWKSDTADEADAANVLQSMRLLGDMKLSLKVGELETSYANLQDVELEVVSAENRFSLPRLDFVFEEGRFESRADMVFSGDNARLDASGLVANLELDHFLSPRQGHSGIPMAGSFELDASGDSFNTLLKTLRGKVRLDAEQTQPEQTRRQLLAEFNYVTDGVDAEVKKLAWGRSEVRGSVIYRNLPVPEWDVNITGGELSLLPWEATLEEEATAGSKEDQSAIRRAASTSASVAKDMLTIPARILTGDAGSEAPGGERFFSTEPIDIVFPRQNNGYFRVQLDKVTSLEGNADNLTMDIQLRDGRINLDAHADNLNGGPARFKLDVDASGNTLSGHLTADFRNVYRSPERDAYPRSGYFVLSSRGGSQAKLAANLDGQVYLEFGRGPVDYQDLAFLTADVGAAMFRALIPGAEKQKPEVSCAVTVAHVQDGVVTTPLGYAVRTRTANLVGAIKADLNTEQLQIQFDSRNHGGSGLAVGNVFSRTVQVDGTLSNPRIVPSTNDLLWRGWAAFMSGGISLVGESIVKRILTADDPCGDLKVEIRKNTCNTDQLLASSPLVCRPQR